MLQPFEGIQFRLAMLKVISRERNVLVLLPRSNFCFSSPNTFWNNDFPALQGPPFSFVHKKQTFFFFRQQVFSCLLFSPLWIRWKSMCYSNKTQRHKSIPVSMNSSPTTKNYKASDFIRRQLEPYSL